MQLKKIGSVGGCFNVVCRRTDLCRRCCDYIKTAAEKDERGHHPWSS